MRLDELLSTAPKEARKLILGLELVRLERDLENIDRERNETFIERQRVFNLLMQEADQERSQ